MRLEQYLQERIINKEIRTKAEFILVDKFINDIKKKCQPFIREITKNNPKQLLMYRGASTNTDMFTKSPRTDRRPTDTPQDVHDALDNAFNDMFGWKARSTGLFCTGSRRVASGFSNWNNPHMIFPNGKYDYLWSDKLADLYDNWTQTGTERHDKDVAQKLVKKGKYHQNTGLIEALSIKSGSEIMVKCKNYHAIHVKYEYWVVTALFDPEQYTKLQKEYKEYNEMS